MNEDNKITAFWEWFSNNNLQLGCKSIEQDLIAQMEDRLFSIRRLDWEIGPGTNAANQFALSPRGDAQSLELTKKIIDRAPKLNGWEFFAAKPPKNWNLVFNLMVDGTPFEFDGKLWEFVAYKLKDGTYDLVFKPDSTKGLSDKYLYWASTIIVDGEIGEEKSMAKVGKIEIVTNWDEKSINSAGRLEVGLLALLIK